MEPLKQKCPHDFPPESRKLDLEDGDNMVFKCDKCKGHMSFLKDGVGGFISETISKLNPRSYVNQKGNVK